jgi:hypothetical protein
MVLPCSFSDHDVQIISLNSFLSNKKSNKIVRKRRYTKAANQKFRNALEIINWHESLLNLDHNQQIIKFYEIMYELINEYYPVKRIIIKNKTYKKWLTRSIKKSCRKKRRMLISLRHRHDDELYAYYKLYQTVLKKTLTTAKTVYTIKTIKNAKCKSKAVWNLVNENTGKPKLLKQLNWKIKTGDEILSDPKCISNTFNNYFIDIGRSNRCHPNNDFSIFLKKKEVDNTKSMFLSPILEYEIITIVKKLKNSNACGPDDIHTSLIKNNIDILCIPLTHIFNQHINAGVFPSVLKHAKVIPIHKKGNLMDVGNYRPISLLSVISKVFEKCLAIRIEKYLNNRNYLSINQYGFRKNKNIVLAVTGLVTEIMNNLNDGMKCAGIFCDLSKAFDCVDHKILLHKLEYYGIRGSVHSLLSSYLCYRQQYVELRHTDDAGNEESVNSDVNIIRCGVPQGSVLGPLLFIIFINDLPDNISCGTPYLYADDTSIIFKGETYDVLNNGTKEGWNSICNWFDANGLRLNYEKSFYMTYRRAVNSDDCILELPISKTDSIRFLGIELDPYLRWHNHIDYISKKLAKACYSIKSMAKIADANTLKIIYFSYVESLIRYGIEVWGNSTSVNKILLIQKKCLRFIERCFPVTHRPLFTKHCINTVISLYIYQISIYVYKNKSSYKKVHQTQSYALRRNSDLALPRSNFIQYKKSINYVAVQIYNHLPNHIKQLEKLSVFSNQLKTYLGQRPFYSLNEFIAKLLD